LGSLASGDPIGAARMVYSFTKVFKLCQLQKQINVVNSHIKVAFGNMAVTFTELFHHYKNKAMKFEL
jgi:hypothetical protein